MKSTKYAPLYWANGKVLAEGEYIEGQIAAHKSLIRELMDDVQELRTAIKRIESKQDE